MTSPGFPCMTFPLKLLHDKDHKMQAVFLVTIRTVGSEFTVRSGETGRWERDASERPHPNDTDWNILIPGTTGMTKRRVPTFNSLYK